MDKLFPVIEFFKKYGFWILCFILASASIGVWFFATGQIDGKNKKLTSEIEQKFSKGNSLRSTSAEEGVSAHANTASEEGMQQKIDEVTVTLVEAWKKRHAAQAGLMKWPDEIKSQNAQFVSTFEQFDPPEAFPDDYEIDKMTSLLEIYKIHIPKSMDRICEIIGTEWPYETSASSASDSESDGDEGRGGDGERGGPGGGGGGRGGDRGEDQEEEEDEVRIICEWNEENQAVWDSKLTNFENRDDNDLDDNIPTPSQIYMLQQDLWLLEAVFSIVREMNSRDVKDGIEMVKANDLATIKRIDHIAFGREALKKLGEITDIVPESEKATTGGMGAERGAPRMPTRGRKDAPDNGYGEIEYDDQPAFHGRYVDENMSKFLTADEVKAALKPGPLPAGEGLGLMVAKRVPVRMAVKINETKIPEFVAACENSPFEFKIWQVRINKHEANEGIVHTGGKSKIGSKKKEQRQMGAAGFGGADNGNEGASSALEFGPVETRTNYDVKAEFYGYVKIYNPVDEARLTGKKAEGEDAAADEADSNPKP